MKLRNAFLTVVSAAALIMSSLASAEESYITIGKPSKVFDTPNAKGYVTLNQKNEEVKLVPGMSFKSIEHSKGWHLIEYFPGLRGYVADNILSETSLPKPGLYKIANLPDQKIKVEKTADGWKATIGTVALKGKEIDNVIVFFNDDKTPAYTLVDLGEGPIAITYDNTVTAFF